MIQGTSASPGIALGKALLIEQKDFNIVKKNIDSIDAEVKKITEAVEKSRIELTAIRDKALAEFGEDKSKLFDSYLMVLDDPGFIDAAIENVRNEKINAE